MTPNFIWPIRVYFEDTDVGGIVYYANYLRFLERARSEWLRTLGIGQAELLARDGLGFAVRSASIEFLRSARLDDQLQVFTAIDTLGRASIDFTQRIERAGEILLTAEVRVACVNLARGRPAAIPETLHEQLRMLT